MPRPDLYATFAFASILLIIIPGPSVLFVISRALAYGRRTALITVSGGACGSFVAAGLTMVGLGVGLAFSGRKD